ILLRDERKLELAAQALEASATSSFSDRVVAFAAAIAIVAEVHDLEILQRIGIVVRALSSLDNLHVTLLASLVDTPRPAGTQPAELENEFNLSADELRPIVRMLELHGLIADEGRFSPGLTNVAWKATTLGELCIKLIRNGDWRTRT